MVKFTATRFSKLATFASLLVGTAAMSGCVGGTTYGTGKSHEAQTLESVSNMFALSNADKQTRIDYSARPDLVVPADKKSLPEPLEESATTSNPDWPESPEQRLARIRAEADANTNQWNQAATDENGNPLIKIETRETLQYQYDLDRGETMSHKTDSAAARKRFQAAKAARSYSNGPKRKWLTEPPTEYRKKTTDIADDDLGLSEEEIKRREKLAEEEKKEHWGRNG